MRAPHKRLGSASESDIKRHEYFRNLDWDAVENRAVQPEFVPTLKDPKVSIICKFVQFSIVLKFIFDNLYAHRTPPTLTRSTQTGTRAISAMTAAPGTHRTLRSFMTRPSRDSVSATQTSSIDCVFQRAITFVLHVLHFNIDIKDIKNRKCLFILPFSNKISNE